jgi:hypothetical protein
LGSQRASSPSSGSRCVQASRSCAQRTSSSQAAFRLGGPRGQVLEAGVLAAADPVLDDGVLAVQLLEPLDPAALLVGDEDLEAVAIVVGEGKLRPGMGTLAADRACPRRPVQEVEAELGTAAPSRCSLAWVNAGRQARSGSARTASRTGSVSSKLTEKRKPSQATWRKACVAPPESARTSSPGPTAARGQLREREMEHLVLFDRLVPVLRQLDRLPLPIGLSVWAVATRPD